jgi:hypothetical protein
MKKLSCITVLVFCVILFSSCKKTTPIISEPSDEELKNTALTPEGISGFIEQRSKSRGLEDDTNYKQAFDSNFSDVYVSMRVLKSLESGDVKKAKQMLQTTMFLDLSFMPVFAKKFKLSPDQKIETEALAKEILNYCCENKNELNPQLPTTKWGLQSLAQTLTETNDLIKLKQLVEFLYKSPASENPK